MILTQLEEDREDFELTMSVISPERKQRYLDLDSLGNLTEENYDEIYKMLNEDNFPRVYIHSDKKENRENLYRIALVIRIDNLTREQQLREARYKSQKPLEERINDFVGNCEEGTIMVLGVLTGFAIFILIFAIAVL